MIPTNKTILLDNENFPVEPTETLIYAAFGPLLWFGKVIKYVYKKFTRLCNGNQPGTR